MAVCGRSPAAYLAAMHQGGSWDASAVSRHAGLGSRSTNVLRVFCMGGS